MNEVKVIPDGMRSVTPHLICAGAADAIEFYDGRLMHASIRIGDRP